MREEWKRELDSKGVWIRRIGALGTGALLALLVSLARGSRREPPGSPLSPAGKIAYWAVDRDAHELYGLDADLLLARKRPLAWPLAVRSTRDGGAWILRSTSGSRAGPCRLDRVDEKGATILDHELGPCCALAVLADDDAIVLQKGRGEGKDRVLRVRGDAGPVALLELPELACAVGGGSDLFVGTTRGEILAWRSPYEGSPSKLAELDDVVSDLACGPSPGSAYALLGHYGNRLVLLGTELEIEWDVATGMHANHIASTPAGGGVGGSVWIADAERPVVRRFDCHGLLEIERADLPLTGLDRLVAVPDGSVVLLATGAILRLDRNGRTMPGQGGFDDLSDIDRVARVR